MLAQANEPVVHLINPHLETADSSVDTKTLDAAALTADLECKDFGVKNG